MKTPSTLIYLIGENDTENDRLEKDLKKTFDGAEIEAHNNSWLAYVSLQKLLQQSKGPDMILIEEPMIAKAGFHFLEEFIKLDFTEKEKIRMFVLTTDGIYSKNLDRYLSKEQFVQKPLDTNLLKG